MPLPRDPALEPPSTASTPPERTRPKIPGPGRGRPSGPARASTLASPAAAASGASASSGLDAADAASLRIRGCTCFRVRRLARRVTQIYDHVLAPSGVRVTQFSLLSAIRSGGATAIGPLAAVMDMDRTTLTRNLKPLVDAGWVTLSRATDDARQREARLTDAGRARHGEASRLWRDAQRRINRLLGETQTASLHRLFDDLFETLGGHGDDAASSRAPAEALRDANLATEESA